MHRDDPATPSTITAGEYYRSRRLYIQHRYRERVEPAYYPNFTYAALELYLATLSFSAIRLIWPVGDQAGVSEARLDPDSNFALGLGVSADDSESPARPLYGG